MMVAIHDVPRSDSENINNKLQDNDNHSGSFQANKMNAYEISQDDDGLYEDLDDPTPNTTTTNEAVPQKQTTPSDVFGQLISDTIFNGDYEDHVYEGEVVNESKKFRDGKNELEDCEQNEIQFKNCPRGESNNGSISDQHNVESDGNNSDVENMGYDESEHDDEILDHEEQLSEEEEEEKPLSEEEEEAEEEELYEDEMDYENEEVAEDSTDEFEDAAHDRSENKMDSSILLVDSDDDEHLVKSDITKNHVPTNKPKVLEQSTNGTSVLSSVNQIKREERTNTQSPKNHIGMKQNGTDGLTNGNDFNSPKGNAKSFNKQIDNVVQNNSRFVDNLNNIKDELSDDEFDENAEGWATLEECKQEKEQEKRSTNDIKAGIKDESEYSSSYGSESRSNNYKMDPEVFAKMNTHSKIYPSIREEEFIPQFNGSKGCFELGHCSADDASINHHLFAVTIVFCKNLDKVSCIII